MEEDVLERAKKKMVLEYASEWFFLSARGREGYAWNGGILIGDSMC